jgi:hypothetical protein
MLNFDNLFHNFFADPKVGDDRLNRYAEEHLKLLGAVPAYAAMTTELTAAWTAFAATLGTKSSKSAIQKGNTSVMKDTLEEFKDLVSQHEGAVRSKWKLKSANYLRFYPRGITEYRNANLKNVESMMSRYQQALVDLGSQLDPAIVTAFNQAPNPATGVAGGVIPRFLAARGTQLGAKGTTQTSDTASDLTRATLEKACMKSLLTVALSAVNLSEVEKADLLRLFPQYILHGHESHTPKVATASAIATPRPASAT